MPTPPPDESPTFPPWLVWSLIVVSLLPAAIHLGGGTLGFDAVTPPNVVPEWEAEAYLQRRAASIHVLLEWTAACIAGITVVFAMVHQSVHRDVTMPIIAAALCFAGLLDTFRALAILGLTESVEELDRFVPFTWALSRTYHACILVAGTLPFVLNRASAERRIDRTGPVTMGIAVAVFVALAYALIHACATYDLPQVRHANWPVSQPWEVLPLVVYIVAVGFVLPRFHDSYPSLFAHGLVLSMVPNVLAQCHAAFGSRVLFDHDSVSAQLLKIVAYLVPLCGLIVDYVRAHESDVAHQATQAKLRVARDVQQGLLPESAPAIPSLDVAGRSEPTDAVGGDYYDFLTDDHGRVGVVVGDVSGHELAASIVLAQTRAYLRALATAHDEIAPMLTELNRFLQGDVRDRWFVTMLFARIAPDGMVEYAAAGHEAAIVRADGSITPLEPTASPLGMMDGEIKSAAEPLAMQPGDVLLVTSDGVSESAAPGGEQYGTARATDLVASLRDRPAREIVDALFDAVAEHRRGPADDDVTVVVARYVG